MVLEPGVAEDHALLPKVGDSEERPFGVGLITEDYIYHFRDLPCFIRGAVYVEHWYGTRDAPGTDTFCTDKILVYKVAGAHFLPAVSNKILLQRGTNFLFCYCIFQGHQIFDQFFPLLRG